jgi:CRP-like cAMP-binding protein
LIKLTYFPRMRSWHDMMLRKLQEHSALNGADISGVRRLPGTERKLAANVDIVKQGDTPNVSVVVLSGMVARYHTLRSGRRQYLSLHIVGDMPDAQMLFLDVMDHALCTIDQATIVMVPHSALQQLFKDRSNVGFAVWRETLIDAAIFREAITNNGARPLPMRLAHFFCEQFYRANAIGLVEENSCSLPLTQTQIGETIGASLPSISRALQRLRRTRAADLRDGRLMVRDWDRLAELGDFNPGYLHLRKEMVP